MIYIYSNGDFHTDKEFAENVLKLGEPIKTLTEQEFGTYEGQVRIIDGVLVLGKTDGEKSNEVLQERAEQAQKNLDDTDWINDKCYELELKTKDVYPELCIQREQWRQQVRDGREC